MFKSEGTCMHRLYFLWMLSSLLPIFQKPITSPLLVTSNCKNPPLLVLRPPLLCLPLVHIQLQNSRCFLWYWSSLTHALIDFVSCADPCLRVIYCLLLVLSDVWEYLHQRWMLGYVIPTATVVAFLWHVPSTYMFLLEIHTSTIIDARVQLFDEQIITYVAPPMVLGVWYRSCTRSSNVDTSKVCIWYERVWVCCMGKDK